MEHINPVQAEKFLKGINYPVSKDDLVQYAGQHGADQRVCDTLKALPNKQFDSPTDVSKAIGQIDRKH